MFFFTTTTTKNIYLNIFAISIKAKMKLVNRGDNSQQWKKNEKMKKYQK